MTHPTISIGLLENAFPIAKVAVISAVLGNINENHPIVKTIRPGPIVDQCAKLATKKKNMASLDGKLALEIPYRWAQGYLPPQPEGTKVDDDLQNIGSQGSISHKIIGKASLRFGSHVHNP